ncbi:hypothetical protein CWC17_14520 [Pseudoalteromonas sp. S3785]|nr:hypothetical protein CWC17_14520 [Pseudoalteromonas sp. S3785]
MTLKIKAYLLTWILNVLDSAILFKPIKGTYFVLFKSSCPMHCCLTTYKAVKLWLIIIVVVGIGLLPTFSLSALSLLLMGNCMLVFY